MRFNWQQSEKEKYFKRAEKQLRDAGIDYISVDRTKFGVKGWNENTHEVEEINVSLTPFPYRHLSNAKKGELMRLGNWTCENPKKRKWTAYTENSVFMHSHLTYKETRGRKAKNENHSKADICKNPPHEKRRPLSQ